jgi:hypothetical protein
MKGSLGSRRPQKAVEHPGHAERAGDAGRVKAEHDEAL